MKEKTNISDHLLIGYLSQTNTEDENQKVTAWLEGDPKNQSVLDKVELIWKSSDSLKDFEAIDLDKNWHSLQGKIHDRQSASGPKWRIWKYAAVILLIAAVSFLVLQPGEVIVQQVTAYNGPKEVLLPDGTIVWLNEGATLDYPEKFSAQRREVSLTGEAFFDVSHNPEQPFVVLADGTATEVLGTTFTISEKEGQVLRLVLTSGKVRFTKGNEQATLAPGQMINVDADGKLTLTENQSKNFMSWKTRKLTFDNTPMKEVIGDISTLYGIVLEIKDREFLNCPLTTTFQDEPLEDVLETIALLFNIEIEQNGQLYQLIGNGCGQ